MHARAGHFPHGVEPWQACGRIQAGPHPAHPVVGGGGHGNWGPGRFQPQFAAAAQDGGKLLLQAGPADGPQIQPEMVHIEIPHPPGQGPADGVPGGQVPPRQGGHWAGAIALHQAGPFTADGL